MRRLVAGLVVGLVVAGGATAVAQNVRIYESSLPLAGGTLAGVAMVCWSGVGCLKATGTTLSWRNEGDTASLPISLGQISVETAGTNKWVAIGSSGDERHSSDSDTCWSANANANGTHDVCLYRSAAGVLALGTAEGGTGAGGFLVKDGAYLQAQDNNAGAPTSTDCDNDSEIGRISIDTTNERLYVCNGAARGWDYAALTD